MLTDCGPFLEGVGFFSAGPFLSKLIFIIQGGVIYFFNNFNIFYEIHPFCCSHFE